MGMLQSVGNNNIYFRPYKNQYISSNVKWCDRILNSRFREWQHGCSNIHMKHVSNILPNKLYTCCELLCQDYIGSTGWEDVASIDVEEVMCDLLSYILDRHHAYSLKLCSSQSLWRFLLFVLDTGITMALEAGNSNLILLIFSVPANQPFILVSSEKIKAPRWLWIL